MNPDAFSIRYFLREGRFNLEDTTSRALDEKNPGFQRESTINASSCREKEVKNTAPGTGLVEKRVNTDSDLKNEN